MISEILVCLEGSTSSRRAVEVALACARTTGAKLLGLAIVDEPEIRAPEAVGIGGSAYKVQRDESLVEDAERKTRTWLNDFLTRAGEAGVAARALEVHGSPLATILEEAQKVDLTVFGRDANFRFETMETDPRTRDAILRGAGKPVLIVPEEAPAELGSPVLVSYDGTLASIRAIRAFAASGLARDRKVFVIHVGDEGGRAWDVAQRGCLLFDELGISAHARHVVSAETVTDALLAERAKLGAGLLVQGAYAHSRFARLLWGSVTKEMLERAPVPLFLHY